MKRAILALLLIAALLAGCTKNNTAVTSEDDFSQGMWISFSEINSMLKSENGFEKELEAVIGNCKKLEISELYIHVRAFCDALYNSKIFPKFEAAQGYEYDILEYIVQKCHAKSIKVHAWINPYRVSSSTQDISTLPESSPVYIWLNDQIPENDQNVIFCNGIYLNPAKYEVQRLVIDGIREILQSYDVDGIHFDDYFYPSKDEAIDSSSYAEYAALAQNPMPLEGWRRSNVNALISGCYTAVKFYNKDIVFSLSPAASLDYNLNSLYADVESWIKSGCVDYIIPQLYFGFEYPKEEFRFEVLLDKWKKLAKANSEVKLLIGLGAYKIGTEAEEDKAEWNSADDIIARQAEICLKDTQIKGFVLFSYSSVFSENKLNVKQKENLIQVVNGGK